MRLFTLLMVLCIATVAWAQDEEAALKKKIAGDACPCFDKIDYKKDNNVEQAGVECIQNAFISNLTGVMEVYGEDVLNEDKAAVLGEEIAMVLLAECPSFIDYGMKIGLSDDSEYAVESELPKDVKKKIEPFVNDLSDKACNCINEKELNGNSAEMEEQMFSCIEEVMDDDPKLQKQFEKVLGKNLTFDQIGEEIGLVMLQRCETFREIILEQVKEEGFEEEDTETPTETPETPTAEEPKDETSVDGVVAKISDSACDCFNKIPEDVSSRKADKLGEKCFVEAFVGNMDAIIEHYGVDAITNEEFQSQLMDDIGAKMIVKLSSDCSSFINIVSKASN